MVKIIVAAVSFLLLLSACSGHEGHKKIGDRIYFKQLKLGQDRYGKIGTISTARPCKE